MKNFLFTFSILVTVLFGGALQVEAESIADFSVQYHIAAEGLVMVTEQIEYDFGDEERRGIFRTLLRTHPQPATAWYKSREVEIAVESVTKNGKAETFEVTESNSGLEVKIGNADVYISGLHTYEIVYMLKGALSSGPEGAEFYWNVTGNGWEVPIASVSAFVTSSPNEILATKTACYMGPEGSTAGCTEIVKATSSVSFRAEGLQPGEGLTIAVEVDPQFVIVAPNEKISYLPFGLPLVFIWLLYFGRQVYKHHTSSRINKPVIAQYEPYADYLPMYTGVLYDGRLDPRDITAGILYLAEQGFLKIKRIETKTLVVFETVDYEIALLREVGEMPTSFLKKVSELLFVESTTPGATVLLSELKERQVANYQVVASLRKSIAEDLRHTGIMTNTLPAWSKAKTAWAVLGVLLVAAFLFVENGYIILTTALFGTGIISIFAFIDRRTQKGYEIKNHLDGFKLFLSVTDKERFEFHNAPEKSPELFMKYLPYAIALGVEKKWAEVFADITIPQPDWYEGSSIGAFSAAALTNDLQSFSTSFSASSGTAGSSGGGSSGGGGGGGGGGSW